MIKNIVFDIGNVLTDFRYRGFLADKGLDAAMIDRIEKCTVDTPYWHEFDRCAISYDEVVENFVALDPEIGDILRSVFADLKGMVTPRDYAIPWIKELKAAGYKVFYLSNFSEKAYIECREALLFDEYCDGGIYSYTERLVKPDPAIYNLLLTRYGLTASECVFFDDTERNVKAAIECGYNSFVFTNPDKANEDLRSLGVKI